MARLFDDASSQYLISGAFSTPTLPITMACWARSNDAAHAGVVMSAGASTFIPNTLALGLRGDVAGDPVRVVHIGSTSPPFPFADTTTGFTVNTWHHVCAVFASTSSRSVYIDGGSKGTDTTAIGGSDAFSLYAIGRQEQGTGAVRYFSGDIAYPCIWDVALSDAEVLSLARGVHPSRIRPEAILHLWNLTGGGSPEPDMFGSQPLTVTNGPTVSTNPRIIIPRSNRIFVSAAVGGTAVPVFAHHYRTLARA